MLLNNVMRDQVLGIALSVVNTNFLKKFRLKMAPDGRAETCSWEIWLKIHFNNCLIESSVRLYFILYIYITIETQRGFFDVLPTVHLSTFISVINQLDAQNFCFTISLFHASTCFQHLCSSSGGQNCIIQPLVSSHL